MSKSGYTLIAIGLILLAYNYSLIDFSLLSRPLVLPIVFIIAGLFSVIKGFFNLGDLGEVISSFIGLLLFFTIIMNIFNFPVILTPSDVNAVVNLNTSTLAASFTDMNFSVEMNKILVNYKSDENNYIESIEYSQNYSIVNSFSESSFDLNNLEVNNLFFDNNFGESSITDLGEVTNSRLSNRFGELIIHTGIIAGEKELRLTNTFGNAKIYLDKDASYSIIRSNAFGSINNNIGILSADYSTAINKILISVDNTFGTVELYSE